MKPESQRAKLTWLHLFQVLQGAINQSLDFSALNEVFFSILLIYKRDFREITTQPMYFPLFPLVSMFTVMTKILYYTRFDSRLFFNLQQFSLRKQS